MPRSDVVATQPEEEDKRARGDRRHEPGRTLPPASSPGARVVWPRLGTGRSSPVRPAHRRGGRAPDARAATGIRAGVRRRGSWGGGGGGGGGGGDVGPPATTAARGRPDLPPSDRRHGRPWTGASPASSPRDRRTGRPPRVTEYFRRGLVPLAVVRHGDERPTATPRRGRSKRLRPPCPGKVFLSMK